MSIAGLLCAGCDHQRGFHPHGNACRMPDCSCGLFAMPVGAVVEDEEPIVKGPRRVTLDLPDGYMLSISLVPYREEPPDGA